MKQHQLHFHRKSVFFLIGVPSKKIIANVFDFAKHACIVASITGTS
jgi:hypothetical protein